MTPTLHQVPYRLLITLIAAILMVGCAGPEASSKGQEASSEDQVALSEGQEASDDDDVIQSKPKAVNELPNFVSGLSPDDEQVAPEGPVPMGHGFGGSDKKSCHVKFHNITRFKVKLFLKEDYEFTLYKYKSVELAFPAGAIDLDAFAVKGEAENLSADLQWSENIKCEPGGKVALQFNDL